MSWQKNLPNAAESGDSKGYRGEFLPDTETVRKAANPPVWDNSCPAKYDEESETEWLLKP